MGHGQYFLNSSESSIFEECIIVFLVWYISKRYRFLKNVLSFFQAPAQFLKTEISRILLPINLNGFGCSSYMQINKKKYIYIYLYIYIYITTTKMACSPGQRRGCCYPWCSAVCLSHSIFIPNFYLHTQI